MVIPHLKLLQAYLDREGYAESLAQIVVFSGVRDEDLDRGHPESVTNRNWHGKEDQERSDLSSLFHQRLVVAVDQLFVAVRHVVAGDAFDVVVLSFDPRDDFRTMARVAEHHGLAAEPGWTFGVAAPEDVVRLPRAIGFWNEWDEERLQFDHPAMLAAVDRGHVVRLLVGATVPKKRLREILWELRHELVPTYPLPAEDIVFRCFSYDPATGGVALDWGMLLLLAPSGVMLFGTLWIFGGARRDDSSLA